MVYLDYELSTLSNRVLEKRNKRSAYNQRLYTTIGGFPVMVSTLFVFGATFSGISKHLKDITRFRFILRYGSALLIASTLSGYAFNILVNSLGDYDEFRYLTSSPNNVFISEFAENNESVVFSNKQDWQGRVLWDLSQMKTNH